MAVCFAAPRAWARLTLLALLSVTTGCASARIITYPGASEAGRVVVDQARGYAGTAYRSGGATPEGFDCSGFVQYLYGRLGISLPRTASDQFEIGREVNVERLAPGDLVFFRTEGHRVSHVGIAVGDGTFIHAPNQRSAVRTDRLDARYWEKRFAGARRLVE